MFKRISLLNKKGFLQKKENFDRGFLFSDAVYEVTSILDGKLVDWQGHFERLKRSLKELNIALKSKK